MICGGGLPATAAPQHFLDAPYRVHGALAQAGQLMIDLIKLFQHDAFSLRIPDLVDHSCDAALHVGVGAVPPVAQRVTSALDSGL